MIKFENSSNALSRLVGICHLYCSMTERAQSENIFDSNTDYVHNSFYLQAMINLHFISNFALLGTAIQFSSSVHHVWYFRKRSYILHLSHTMLIPIVCMMLKFITNCRNETELQAIYMKNVVCLQNTTQINPCTSVTGIISNIAKTIRSFGCDSMIYPLQHIL